MVVQQRTSKGAAFEMLCNSVIVKYSRELPSKEDAAFEMLCNSVIVKYSRELPSKEDAAFEMHLPSCL